ncbi:glucokinase [Paraglaciecola chathamensis]|uniref:Glucokinase n=1 Tax=Paraglaciecola agarilytica NO2 TaxID=1125747 RepID=A0ABQ0I3C1_9ALTE|nr:glucokinase [Paraglaciecola agarilytica]GAC03828.1 glucokinase [Paraglaciecola agarilytica NO2]
MAANFVADIGGTNIRLAQVVDGQVAEIRKYLCADFATVNDAIKQYFSEFPTTEFAAGCLAIACPVAGDLVKMTNHTWAFSIKQVQADLGLSWLGVINDFTSVAHSLPKLDASQKVQIGPGEALPEANIAVFGPGTGLGVEHLTCTDGVWKALDGEGGHVDFSAVDENDIAILRFLTKKLGHASAEEVMSGRGIVHIYQGLAAAKNVPSEYSDAADITSRAIDNSCSLCRETLEQFCRIMGSFAGNLALNLCTRGGVYIGGGIASRFVEFIQQSEFRARFEAKGRFRDYVAGIPTYIITEPDHGLIGAMAYLQQHYKG